MGGRVPEAQTLGFNVYREAPAGKVRVNGRLVRAKGALAGPNYTFVDRSARHGVYWV